MIDLDFVVSARKLASFTGQIISIGPIIGNIAMQNTDQTLRNVHHVCPVWGRNRRIEPTFDKSRQCFLTKTPHIFAYSDASIVSL